MKTAALKPSPQYAVMRSDADELADDIFIMNGAIVVATMSRKLSPSQVMRHARMLAASRDMFNALTRAIAAQPLDADAKWIEHAQRAIDKARRE
jgi:hypothetical protein